jgi:flagellar basal-body rod protein FlgF
MATGGYRAEETRFETLLAEAGAGPVAFASPGETFISRRAGEASSIGCPATLRSWPVASIVMRPSRV